MSTVALDNLSLKLSLLYKAYFTHCSITGSKKEKMKKEQWRSNTERDYLKGAHYNLDTFS